MSALATERILLVGDHDRTVQAAVSEALPTADIASSASYFDAIADLTAGRYSSILAAAAPIERRPEPAIRALRQLAGDARLLLFGDPGFEPLSRKMIDFGIDDYLITPANPAELRQMLGAPPMRISPTSSADGNAASEPPAGKLDLLAGLPLTEILLDALVQHPFDSLRAAVAQIDSRIGPTMQLILARSDAPPPPVPEGHTILTHVVRLDNHATSTIHLLMPRDEDETTARHIVAQLAHLGGRLTSLQDRHSRLQRLAITDDLTGLYNGRYFRVFLSQILEKARLKRFPVTLLLFDIDNFKSYNDRFGHAIGDLILKQSAKLIRACCREHDHVARISGDEFAVIFWEKEGPRQPREPKPSVPASRVPQTIVQILERFRHAIANSNLEMLGAQGRGVLSISGGLAVYPFDAHTPEHLYEAADKALMFHAKRGGKNSIYIVGGDEANPENPQ
jgi:GGDEF domain-containing protein